MRIVCPTCSTLIESNNPKGRRNCSLCGKNIGRHDKWFINSDGKLQHRHCDYPENYTHPEIKQQPK